MRTLLTPQEKLSYKLNRNINGVEYLKVDVSRSKNTQEWVFYKLIFSCGLAIKVIPNKLRITVVNVTGLLHLFEEHWLRKTKEISKSMFDRRFEGAIKDMKDLHKPIKRLKQ